MESKAITSFEDLRQVRLADDGYIVISDATGNATIHRVNAKCVSTENFNAKVRLGGGKQGGYFWVDSIATAAHELGAKRCKVCMPEVFLVDRSSFGT